MALGEALEIVYDLAKQNALVDDHGDLLLAEEVERQKLALDTVHDFIAKRRAAPEW